MLAKCGNLQRFFDSLPNITFLSVGGSLVIILGRFEFLSPFLSKQNSKRLHANALVKGDQALALLDQPFIKTASTLFLDEPARGREMFLYEPCHRLRLERPAGFSPRVMVNPASHAPLN